MSFMGQSRPTSLPSLGGSAVRVPIPLGGVSRSFDYSDRVRRNRKLATLVAAALQMILPRETEAALRGCNHVEG